MNTRRQIALIYNLLDSSLKKQLHQVLLVLVLSSATELLLLYVLKIFFDILAADKPIAKLTLLFNTWNLNISQSFDYVLIATAFFFLVILTATVLRIGVLFNSSVFSAKVSHYIAQESFEKILRQDYEKLTTIPLSEIITLLSNNTHVLSGVISTTLMMVSSVCTSIAVISGLLFISLPLTVISFVVFSLIYFCYASFSRPLLLHNSSTIQNAIVSQHQSIKDSIDSIQNIILSDSLEYFKGNFKASDSLLKSRLSSSNILASIPRYLIEFATLTLLFIIFLFSLDSSVSANTSLIESLGLIGIASLKLIPAFQQVFVGWSSVKGSSSAIESITTLYENRYTPSTNQDHFSRSGKIITNDFIFESLELCDVFYRYPKREDYALSAFSIKINKGDCIGIRGQSGAGKSTLINILLTLLQPTHGTILINDHPILLPSHPLVAKYRASLSFMPQRPFILRSTFIENIALGQQLDAIDYNAVGKAIEMTSLGDVLLSMPHQYNTLIGDGTLSLSGGQMQRLCLARALYTKSQILIFDEPTSSLDPKTEVDIIETLRSLRENHTIILVSHRQSLFDMCDRVIDIQPPAMTCPSN